MIEIPHFHFERVSSTNDVAKELLDVNNRVFVTADYQYSGRGRKGRVWEGESYKNVYLSYGINEVKSHSLKNVVLYQIVGCLAVLYTLSNYIDKSKIRIKYPNDIYIRNSNVEYKKIAGILSEHSYSGSKCTESILGIGINVNQMEFDISISKKATSMKLLIFDCDIDEIIKELKKNILEILQKDENSILEEWKNELTIKDKEVTLVKTGSIYKIETVNSDGTLTGVNQNGSIRINNGDSITYELK